MVYYVAYPEILTRDPTFSDRTKTESILRNLGLDPKDFNQYLSQINPAGTSPEEGTTQSQQPENQQRTVPNEFDNEGEVIDLDDLFSVSSVEGLM